MRVAAPLCVFALLAISPTCSYGGFDEGAAAYRAGDYQAAFKEWSVAAQHGDVDAQYNLGCLYLRGEGVAENGAWALEWLQRAADQGDLDASTWLLFSKPVTEDRRKQFLSRKLTPTDKFRLTFVVTLSDGKLHRRPCKTDAADGAEIESNLGLLYENGIAGFPQDDTQAAEWYRRASERDFADAQTRLAFLYAQGRGVEKNQVEAARLFRRAAEQGNAFAQHALGIMYATGSFGYSKYLVAGYVLVSHVAAYASIELSSQDLAKLRELLSPDQLAEGERLAGRWQKEIRWSPELAERIGPPH